MTFSLWLLLTNDCPGIQYILARVGTTGADTADRVALSACAAARKLVMGFLWPGFVFAGVAVGRHAAVAISAPGDFETDAHTE